MSVSVPPGRRHELELSERLADIDTEVGTVRATLPSVNDPGLHRRVTALADLAAALVAVHEAQPGPDVAEALTGLLSATRALRVPARDPELGRTPTLDGLRAVQGRLVMALTDALDATQALGLHPRHLPIIREQAVDIPRAGNERLLRGIAERLDEVAQRLSILEATRTEPTPFVQQTGLLDVYLRAMQVEIDLARLQLTIGDVTVDFGALSRAAEAMGGLTRDFVATVRAWVGRVSDGIVWIAEDVRTTVRRVATGIRAATKWIARRAQRTMTSSPMEVSQIPDFEVTNGHPPDFDIREVARLVLAAEPVPAGWEPFVTALNLSNSGLADLRSFATLTRLRSLTLSYTQARDLAPLAALSNLQYLSLRNTQVSDVASLAMLTRLQVLDLRSTRVIDLAPLAALTGLQNLYAGDTQVNDLAPLAALISLEHLDLGNTQATDLAPLAALTRLQYLTLSNMPVSNVAPLATLTSLQSLDLNRTQVSDVAPLAALSTLQILYLMSTQVGDVAPLAALTSLRILDLRNTQVNDVGALQHLTNLHIERAPNARHTPERPPRLQ
jgi:hypothetical protein